MVQRQPRHHHLLVPRSAAAAIASMFADRTRSGIITPFGSLVEPLVYCRMTSRSGSAAASRRHRRVGTFGAPGRTARQRLRRRVARRRLRRRRAKSVVDEQQLGVAVADARPCRGDELVERAHAHRQRQHHRGQPGQPAAADGGDQRPARRPEHGDVVARDQAARLQGGGDGACLVVDLPPRDRDRAGRAPPRRRRT